MVNDKILPLFASLQNYIHSLGGFKVTLSSVCARTHKIAGPAKTSPCILVSKVLPNAKQTPELSSVRSLFKLCTSNTDLCCGK